MRLWDALVATASGVEDEGSYDSPHSADNCAARRAAAFRVTAEELGLPRPRESEPYGVIIETDGPRGLSTLIAFANGDASLLHQNGSGIIGRQNHVHVVKQAKRLVAEASDLVSVLTPAEKILSPDPGAARIYFLTRGGLVSAQVPTLEWRIDTSPWFNFLGVAEDLTSELRQYLLGDPDVVGPPQAAGFLRSAAMVVVIGGATYVAWLIPIAWIRWPLVCIGLFFTAAALFVFYLLLAGGRDEMDENLT